MRNLPLFAALALAGCAKSPALPPLEGLRPSLSLERVEVTDLTFDHVDTAVVFSVENPFPASLEMQRIRWSLELAEAQVLTGLGPGATLPASTAGELTVPITVRYADILPALRAAGDLDELPWTLTGAAAFETPVGLIEVPFTADGTLPALQPPTVGLESLRLRRLDVRDATAEVELVLTVDSPQILSVERLDYTLSAHGEPVAEGLVDDLALGRAGRLTVPMTLDLHQAGELAVDAFVTRDALQLSLDATAEVRTPFGIVPLRIDRSSVVDIVEPGAL